MSTAKAFLSTLIVFIACCDSHASQSSDYVILSFTAQWCQPCKEMSKATEQLSEQGWLIRQIDVDREKGLVQRWQVQQIPTLVILQDGREVDRVTGQLSYPELAQRLPKTSSLGNARISDALPLAQSAPSVRQEPQPPRTDPLLSTVRIKIDDGHSTSFGSGTIIDQHGEEALVLTCGHLFRDLNQRAIMTVDVPIEGRLVTMPATVVDYRCDETDIGLIAFRPGHPVVVASLLPRGVALKEQDSVSSFGCDHGADPTRRDSYISKLNRYVGPSNVEVANAPVQGRSGGGLFNDKGQLIGVCYAADSELNEGLYSGPEVVYQQLARLGLSRLYHRESQPASNALVASQSQPPSSPASPGQASVPAAVDPFPDRSMGDDWKAAIGQAAQATRATAVNSIASAMRDHQGVTLTAIVRAADGQEQRITIPSPSPALLQALQSHSDRQPEMVVR